MNTLKEYTKQVGRCWIWQRSIRSSGYWACQFRGRADNAHRVAYILAFGEVPPGLSVLHTCDVKLCVKPWHLWAGTQYENMEDMTEKGRRCMDGPGVRFIGEANPMSKLTDHQREDIVAANVVGD